MNVYDLTMQNRADALPLDQVHFSEQNKAAIDQLLKEFKHLEALKAYGLPVDNKLLLHGHTGCGKTTTARAIAAAIDKKIFILNLGSLVSSKLGETARNITAVFRKVEREKAVIFIDEFDYIAKRRDSEDKDAGEMKRLVNTIIQLIDYLPESCLLIAATNYYDIIDTAILRRFQLKLKFELPTKQQLDSYYDELLMAFPEKYQQIERSYQVSYAEAKDLAYQQLKQQIIQEQEQLALSLG